MSSEKKMITLKSSDGETFEIEEAVALQSEKIKHMVGDGSAGNAIPLPEVDGATLGKVLEYCNRHVIKEKEADDLKAWDKDYLKDVKNNRLDQLLEAALYLDIEGLLNLTGHTLVDRMKPYTFTSMRSIRYFFDHGHLSYQ